MTRDELTAALTTAFEGRPEVVAVTLDGRLGRGGGDDLSDVDLHVIVADEHVRTITAAVPELVWSVCDPDLPVWLDALAP